MGYCGNKCEQCPIFRGTRARDQEALRRCSQEWGRLYGRVIPPDRLACEGCYREIGLKMEENCAIRGCCQGKGQILCARCSDYPCTALEGRFISRAVVEERLGRPLDEETYRLYVAPFETKNRLDQIHRRYSGAVDAVEPAAIRARECECLDGCPFFNDRMENMPILTGLYKQHYCKTDNSECARHLISVKCGREAVPTDLYPHQKERALRVMAERGVG